MTTTAAPKPTSVWEDFIDIFVSPAQVFARRRGGGFFLPLVVLTVVMAALFVGTKPLMQPVYDAMFDKQVATMRAQRPELTEEQIAQARKVGNTIATVGAVVAVPIAAVVVGFVLWLVGKFFDSTQTVGDAMMVATYAQFPKILALIVGGGIAYFSDPARLTSPYSVTAGLGAFLGPDASPVLQAVLGRIDVFTIWVTVLLGVGLYVTGKVPKGRAAAAAVIMWVIGALPTVLGALRQG